MILRLPAALICAVLVAVAPAGCSVGGGDEAGGADELDVQVSLPLHGPAGRYGRAIRDGAKLALAEEPPGGGADSPRRLGLRFGDDTAGGRWSAAATAENARRATSDSAAIAYVGELESGATRTSLPITNEAAMVQVSPASTAVDLVAPFPGSDEVPELVQPTGERTFGRVIPDDEVQAAAGAAWAEELGARNALVVSDRSEFGDTVADEFAEEAEALGISVETTGASGATRVVRSNPDLVYFGGTPDGAPPVLDRVARLSDATIMGTDALLLDRTFLRRARSFEGPLRLTSAAQDPSQLPGPAGKRFVDDYRQHYGRSPGRYAAYGYEAMALVLDLVKRAGDEAGNRGAIVDELFSTGDRESVLGTYSIDDVGNTTLDRIAGYRVRGGRPVFAVALRAP